MEDTFLLPNPGPDPYSDAWATRREKELKGSSTYQRILTQSSPTTWQTSTSTSQTTRYQMSLLSTGTRLDVSYYQEATGPWSSVAKNKYQFKECMIRDRLLCYSVWKPTASTTSLCWENTKVSAFNYIS